MSEYAIADAIFPAVTLAWLLATHGWLVATSPRGRYAAAIGSAALSGYAYAVHPRGTVLLAGYAAVGPRDGHERDGGGRRAEAG